ncbi:hypothetical protein XNW1_4040001 [Xenorhabdus nematophila str. Websteri]|nr:hypothetical protein XNW1_4040001 [Xenorhabdus nematophila str. Websteri]
MNFYIEQYNAEILNVFEMTKIKNKKIEVPGYILQMIK